MKCALVLKVLVLTAFLGLLFPLKVMAQGSSFVTIVHPIRGEDFWGSKPGSPLLGAKFQKDLVDRYQLPATWLLRYDVLEKEDLFNYFKSFATKNRQELGLFLEVMPGMAKAADVGYPQGGVFWHDANKIFLSGYKVEQRQKLIDQIFRRFQERLGYYPRSVGAWHVDAFSADYMRRKYNVRAVLICADQFGTDGYQIWGGFWGVPFYPSKFNILMPAQTKKNKLDAVVFWWAARDPRLGYGGSFEESTFSVQINDYVYHGKGAAYFNELLDIYLKNPANRFNQLTVGIENDYDFQLYGKGYEEQMKALRERVEKGEIKAVTMGEFVDWYRGSFKGISPEHQIGDWLMSPRFRLATITKDGQKFLRDLRIYNENWPETNLLTANPWGTLALNNPYKIDTVRFPKNFPAVGDGSTLGKLIKQYGGQKIPFQTNRFLLFWFCLVIVLIMRQLFRGRWTTLILLAVGVIAWSLTMVKSGLVYSFGMGFWGPNGHDGIWHLAIINQLAKFSLVHPGLAGLPLTNYHFGFDFLAALVHRLSGISTVTLYFQILPPVMALLIGILTFKLVESWTASKKSAWWATFFVFFGGSWGWLLGLIRDGHWGGESVFWANQAVSTLINPPYALSLILLLAGLLKLKDYLKKPDRKSLLLTAVLLGVLLEVKVYAGIICLGSLAVLTLWSLIFKGEKKVMVKLFLTTLAISLAVFLPFNWHASSLLVFSPLWLPHTMLAFGDRLGWFKLENARLTFFNSHQWWKWFLAEGLALVIFILGNLGTRVLGFWEIRQWLKNWRKIKTWELFSFSAMLIALVFPLIFIQKGNSWNTIQFFYYFQFFLGISAGKSLGYLWEENLKGREKFLMLKVFPLVVVVLTLPTTWITLKNNYWPSRPPARISIEELEALEFLRRQPEGVVLTPPFNSAWRAKFSEPRPLYAYETSAYITALTGKPSFLADEMNLEISGYSWQKRREESLQFFLTNKHDFANNLIKQNKIAYIYLVKGQKMNLGEDDVHSQRIFENGEVKIFKIN